MIIKTSDAILKDGTIHRYVYNNVVLVENNKYYVLASGIDISEKMDLERKLIESVIQTEEAERRRIASDLHDGLGPELTTIKLYVQGLLDAKEEKVKKETENKLLNLIDHTIDSISEISFNISPHILLNYGLAAAVTIFIDKLHIKRDINIVTHFDKIQRFGINEELTLYRTIKELFNNRFKI